MAFIDTIDTDGATGEVRDSSSVTQRAVDCPHPQHITFANQTVP